MIHHFPPLQPTKKEDNWFNRKGLHVLKVFFSIFQTTATHSKSWITSIHQPLECRTVLPPGRHPPVVPPSGSSEASRCPTFALEVSCLVKNKLHKYKKDQKRRFKISIQMIFKWYDWIWLDYYLILWSMSVGDVTLNSPKHLYHIG